MYCFIDMIDKRANHVTFHSVMIVENALSNVCDVNIFSSLDTKRKRNCSKEKISFK